MSGPGIARRAAAAAAAAAGLVALGWVTAGVARAYAVSSDDATGVLEAEAVLRGNPLLRGWTLSNVSFVATDLPFYLAAVAARGVRPALLRDVPAGVYVAAVAAAAWLARGRGGRAWLGVAAAAVLLGLPAGGLAEFVTKGYIRVGTTLGLFLGLIALDAPGDRPPSARRLALFAAALGLTVLSDSYALAVGLLPVLIVAGLGLSRVNRYGPGRSGPAALAAVAGAAGGLAGASLIRAAGGFAVVALPLGDYLPTPDPLGVVARNAGVLAANLPSLYRCEPPAAATPAAVALGLACLAGPALLAVALAGTPLRPRAGGRPPDFVGDVLWVSMAVGLAAYLLSGNPKDRGTMRYLVPFVLSGAVLTGRRLAGLTAGARPAAAALGVLGVAYAATVARDLARPPAPDRPAALADWLAARGLTHGYGPYWDASVVTVFGAGRVAVRPVTAERGVVEPFRWMSDDRWYAEGPATFVAFRPRPGTDYHFHVDDRTCAATFGPPAARHAVGPYAVLVYPRDLRPLLRRPSR